MKTAVKLSIYTCLSLILGTTPAFAQEEQCTETDQSDYNLCLSEAVDACQDLSPGCSNVPNIVEATVARTRTVCTERTVDERQCKRCVALVMRDARRGAGRVLFSGFSRELLSELRDVRANDCDNSEDASNEEESSEESSSEN